MPMYRPTELILRLDLSGRCRAQKFENVIGIENHHQRRLRNVATYSSVHVQAKRAQCEHGSLARDCVVATIRRTRDAKYPTLLPPSNDRAQ